MRRNWMSKAAVGLLAFLCGCVFAALPASASEGDASPSEPAEEEPEADALGGGHWTGRNCWDGRLPAGPVGYETNDLGAGVAGFNLQVGAQAGVNQPNGYGGSNLYLDACYVVSAPKLTVGPVSVGGQVADQYVSERFFTSGYNPCEAPFLIILEGSIDTHFPCTD